MKVFFKFRYLQNCEIGLESNEFDTLQQCINDLRKEIDRLDDSLLRRALVDQFTVLTKKIPAKRKTEVRT